MALHSAGFRDAHCVLWCTVWCRFGQPTNTHTSTRTLRARVWDHIFSKVASPSGALRRLLLFIHPDRNKDDPNAKTNFQILRPLLQAATECKVRLRDGDGAARSHQSTVPVVQAFYALGIRVEIDSLPGRSVAADGMIARGDAEQAHQRVLTSFFFFFCIASGHNRWPLMRLSSVRVTGNRNQTKWIPVPVHPPDDSLSLTLSWSQAVAGSAK